MTSVATLAIGPESIAGLSAIFGSLVGALGSSTTTWIIQRYQDRRSLLAKVIVRRETLYSDFINETARLLVDAAEHNANDPNNFIPAYALLSRIRLGSTSTVLAAAEDFVREMIAMYSKPNLATEEIEFRAIHEQHPLRNFSDVCRAELESMQRQV